jgi:DNA processing protein
VYLVGSWDHPGPLVAIVGARDATDDGIDVARELARALAVQGIGIVSGLARGIDAAAHQGALGAGGASGAVLGTSLDEIYPREHASLQRTLSRSLGLMSEIAPGAPATKGTFATRNRILAAIADAVLVVQGRPGSGSLITAREALRLGRPVGALPWDSREPLGEASHELIHAGKARLVRHAEDVLDLLGMAADARGAEAHRSRVTPIEVENLPPHEAALYRALRERPRSLDYLAAAASLTAAELGAALLALELNGLARRAPGGLARRSRRRP